MVADQGRRQALVGDHAVLDGVAEVDEALRGGSWLSGRGGAALVAFADDLLVEDAHLADHQQAQVAHDISGELGVGDAFALDVEAEALALDAAAVGEVDFEVELDAVVVAACCIHGGLYLCW